MIQLTTNNSTNQDTHFFNIAGRKVSLEVRWKQKWKRFKSNLELECGLLTEYCLSILSSCPDSCLNGLIFWTQSRSEAKKTKNIYPRGSACLRGSPLSHSLLSLSFLLPSWTMLFLCFPSPFHMFLQQTYSPLFSLYIPPQAKCTSSNALKRWTMWRRWRLAFEMVLWWPKWVSCMQHGSSSFWTAVKPAGWRMEVFVTQ